MVLLRRLVELEGFPERQGQEFFTSYLHLLETHMQTELDHQNPYEGELLNLTRSVFQCLGATHTHTLGFETMQLLECVCTLGGAGQKLGEEVSQSLCLIFDFLLSVAPDYVSAALLWRPRVTQVCEALAHTVGTENQAEVAFHCILFLCHFPLHCTETLILSLL